jgi:hypothetical protein
VQDADADRTLGHHPVLLRSPEEHGMLLASFQYSLQPITGISSPGEP